MATWQHLVEWKRRMAVMGLYIVNAHTDSLREIMYVVDAAALMKPSYGSHRNQSLNMGVKRGPKYENMVRRLVVVPERRNSDK